MISYKQQPFSTIFKVFLDGKWVGEIRKVQDGYKYYPKGNISTADVFPSLELCKKSLEEN